MNTEQTSPEHLVVFDYDTEAASQPTLPARSHDNRIVKDTKDSAPEKSNFRGTLSCAILVLLVLAATAVAVWFVMDDSRSQKQEQIQPAQSDGFTSVKSLSSVGPALEISGIKPLSICMGDCDEDSDCGPGLMCFQRNAYESVPGCFGGANDESRTDYCIPVELPHLVISETFPLGLCEGDCDSNDDCDHDLVCYQRSGFQDVPGCSGGSLDGSRTDYCVPRSLVPETYLISLGEKLVGNPDDNFGSAVSLSQTEPLLMAVGAVDRGSTGYVSIYKLEADDAWVLAATIPGDEVGSDFGRSVSMSWDGKYVAVGMPESKDSGRVKVFQLSMTNSNEISWNQAGNEIPLGPSEEYGGYAVSLSKDGSILAVTERYSFFTLQRTDYGDWVMLGSKVTVGSFGGDSISLSGDGSRVAVNVKPDDMYPPDGYGRVYEFSGTEWTQVGKNLGDLTIYDSFGLDNIDLTSTSLSGDGTTVVMSCIDRRTENSYVRVYRDMGDSEWVPMGDPILGKLNEYAPASKVEISKDGAVVAIGDYELGRLRLYEYDSRVSHWILVGEVHAENEDDQLGISLSLAGGRAEAYLAIGGPNKKHILGNPGFVDTYKTTFSIRPDPTTAPSSAPTEWIDGSSRDSFLFSHGPEYVWSGRKNGNSNDGIAGNSVALSGDGKVFAYGSSSEAWPNRVVIHEDDSEGGRDPRPHVSGSQLGDEFGYSIALSSDGLVMAVGIPNSDVGTVEGAGSVKVYLYDHMTKTWTQMGGDIVGSLLKESGRFGHSVSLNSNGEILAIGAPSLTAVSTFRFDNNEWVKMGDDITVSEDKFSWHGWSISLSSDGLVLAAGGPTNEENWDEAGACRIYEFVNSNWQQRGHPILGEQRHGLLGTSVSLSGDGNIVAIGAINYQLPEAYINKEEDVYHNGQKAGAVLVFEYSPEGNWKRLGKPIFGNAAYDRSGMSVSLTKDGKKLAVGAPEHGEGGQVRLFAFDKDHLYWDQIGDAKRYDSLDDAGKNGGFGTSVALVDCYDGLRMMVGAPRARARYGEMLGLTPKYVGEVSIYDE
ncbi:unnamed protein product [Cylindrotheca closterium]|uniref:Uncharacterized protein n=1 Tax=Cylindrotheca closterium TaxID=2856 RepID=A0AAD2CBT0_9STRA|nr:unnamed protein product [Cylindrotheca closterium]